MDDGERFTRTPERILAAMAAANLRSRHFRTLLAIVQNSYRWPEPREVITSRFLAAATGLSRRAIRLALDDLVESKILSSLPGRGSRGGSFSINDPELWKICGRNGVPTSGRYGVPTSGRNGVPTKQTSPDGELPLVGATGCPLVGTPLRHNLREKRENSLLGSKGQELEAVNTAFGFYPNPKTKIPRKVRRLAPSRMSAITRDHLAGDRSKLPSFLAHAIHGYVCRNGIKIQESGFESWKFFELASIISPSKLETNVAAAREAVVLGNLPPYSRGSNEKRKRQAKSDASELSKRRADRERKDKLRAELDANAEAMAKLSPLEQLEERRSELLKAGPDSDFRRSRLSRIEDELAGLVGGGKS